MNIVYDRHGVRVAHGDNLEVLAELPDHSVSAVITDPPYGIRFMGQAWDGADIVAGVELRRTQAPMPVNGKAGATGGYQSPSTEAGRYNQTAAANRAFQDWCATWAAECLRVLKPGGHLAAFGGTRTFHRLACGIEDVGFEIRDSIGVAGWVYGSGFPKSLDVSKAIDRVRDDRADVQRVTSWLAVERDRAGWTNRTIDAEFGFDGMAVHWTAAPHVKIAMVPTPEQWKRLRALLGFGPEMDAEVARLNHRKGDPGEAWAQRTVVGQRTTGRGTGHGAVPVMSDSGNYDVTAPHLDAASRWAGWGTALKPAWEPIVLARKPLAGTVAGNVLTHGSGALHIDACRTGTGQNVAGGGGWATGTAAHTSGRWPTNAVLVHHPDCGPDDAPAPCAPGCPVAELDRQSGSRTSGYMRPEVDRSTRQGAAYGLFSARTGTDTYGDTGGASRFFPAFRWEAKAPSSERPHVGGISHPTVKPVALMRWLVRLLTPPDGLVLDPFAGSGTTGQACRAENVRCLLIEREPAEPGGPDYIGLIQARLDGYGSTVSREAAVERPLNLLDLLYGDGTAS